MNPRFDSSSVALLNTTHYSKKGSFSKNFKQNVFCHKFGRKFVKSFVSFEQTCYFFIKKSKTLRSLWDKFVSFDQKRTTHGILGIFGGDRANFSGVIGCRMSRKGRVLRALHSVPLNMGVVYNNLNFNKYLLVISIFATLAGGR